VIDYEIKIADRFSYENRDPILRSVCTCGPEPVFQSLIDLKMQNADRFPDQNRSPIFPERFSIAIVIAIVALKSGSDCEMVFLGNKHEPIWFTSPLPVSRPPFSGQPPACAPAEPLL
jgi:hypothetical protein